MDFNAPGRFVHLWVAGAVLMAVSRLLHAGEPSTPADASALREFALASPELEHMNSVLAVEMTRILSGSGEKPSPEVMKFLSAAAVDLGDTRIPLHLRFIERQRRELVAGIAAAKTATAGHCPASTPPSDQFLDAAVRAQVLAGIKCHQRAMDLYQSGTHSANQAYENMLLDLKLPPNTQAKMLAAARASTARQDADLLSNYAKERALLQANWDLFTYLDEHAAHAHYANGAISFENPADTKAMQDLSNRVASLTQ